MDKPSTPLVIIALLVLTGALTGCGYQLRRYPSDALFAHHTHQVKLVVTDPQAKKVIQQKLHLMGYVMTDDSPQANIGVQNLNIRQYELIGILTEIRLILTADVSYQIGTKTHRYTLQATRSYQYNKATVSASDTEREAIKDWLYQELAYKIGEQYRILLEQSPVQDTH